MNDGQGSEVGSEAPSEKMPTTPTVKAEPEAEELAPQAPENAKPVKTHWFEDRQDSCEICGPSSPCTFVL